MILSRYRSQVELLLKLLPIIAKEECFALKGGTAINLFVRDLPRLSVDIDLTYLPVSDRSKSLKGIHESLNNVKVNIEKTLPHININSSQLKGSTDVKLNCQYRNAQIKIEVNTVTRGHLFPVRLMQVKDKVLDEFGQFAAINVVSHEELYAGKICAALDRQHPRDLFDVYLLFQNEGLTTKLKDALILSLISHYKPVRELINPMLKDQHSAFETQFSGMTLEAFTYEDYETTRINLIDMFQKSLTEKDKQFLLSFEKGNPDWDLYEYPKVNKFPAVKWKLLNIKKLKKANPEKYKSEIEKLSIVLNFK